MSTCSPAGLKMGEGDTGGGGRRGRSDLGVARLSSSMSATPAGTSSCCQCPERDQERVGEMLRRAASQSLSSGAVARAATATREEERPRWMSCLRAARGLLCRSACSWSADGRSTRRGPRWRRHGPVARRRATSCGCRTGWPQASVPLSGAQARGIAGNRSALCERASLRSGSPSAQPIQAVPGRKTDVKDAQGIAELLAHGVVRPSCIPPREQRELRDLTRSRVSFVRERATLVNRVPKLLEGANRTLCSVLSDVMGVAGRAMLSALLAGETDPPTLAELACGQLRPEARAALARPSGRSCARTRASCWPNG